MESINTYVEKAKKGDKDATERIVRLMLPLIRKYASKIHFMEYEDVCQELSISILECIPYLDFHNSPGKLVKSIEKTVLNKYRYLCKKNLPREESCVFLEEIEEEGIREKEYEDCELKQDLQQYLEKMAEEDVIKKRIARGVFFEGLTDKEMAGELGISKQYVNRIKKKLIKDFFEKKNRL